MPNFLLTQTWLTKDHQQMELGTCSQNCIDLTCIMHQTVMFIGAKISKTFDYPSKTHRNTVTRVSPPLYRPKENNHFSRYENSYSLKHIQGQNDKTKRGDIRLGCNR